MESIGAEVGQKMKCAIKAKLLELNCYVDDELPDYVMVMVANKRSKSQMNEDLNLFLANKTPLFVNWLHIVLKKLKEVSVTNPEVYKKVVKRKSADRANIEVDEKKCKIGNVIVKNEEKSENSLTDNLPIISTQLDKNRRITIVKGENIDSSSLSLMKSCSKEELEDIEKRIKSVKERLGDLVEEESNILQEEMSDNAEKLSVTNNYRTVELQDDISKFTDIDTFIENVKEIQYENTDINSVNRATTSHSPIIFDGEKKNKRVSILNRLGKKTEFSQNQKRIKLSEFRKEEEKYLRYNIDCESKNVSQTDRNHLSVKKTLSLGKRDNVNAATFGSQKYAKKNIHSRFEVMSKVHVPLKEEQNELDEVNKRGVKSVVYVKPRVIPIGAPQPSKNLLLKAVAEAQQSIIQASRMKTHRVDKLLNTSRELEQTKNQHLMDTNLQSTDILVNRSAVDCVDNHVNIMHVSKSLQKNSQEISRYLPSFKSPCGTNERKTVNNIMLNEDELHIAINMEDEIKVPRKSRISVKQRLQEKKSPSPIIFATENSVQIKVKERCKYFPKCREGDKCEFLHPSSNCENFPNCKFGEKCLYLHPICKFGSSCTKRNCPFTHELSSQLTGTRVFSHKTSKLQICKYHPYCSDPICRFYHPQPVLTTKSSLSWRLK